MGFFNRLFRKQDKRGELVGRVPDLIGPFIDCAMLAVDVVKKKTGQPLPEFSQLTILVFVFGALDELCQCLELNEQETFQPPTLPTLAQKNHALLGSAQGYFVPFNFSRSVLKNHHFFYQRDRRAFLSR